MNKALVFGVTGQLGAAVAEQLLASGWLVWGAAREGRAPPAHLLHRGLLPVDPSRRGYKDVVRSLGCAVDAAFVPVAYDDADARALLSASTGIGMLVVVSSSSVYADKAGRSLDEAAENGFPEFDGPIGEDTSTVEPGPETYSTRKIAMEQVLLSSDLPVTILRPCAIYGRFARHPREWWFVKRAMDGRRHIPVAYNAQSVFHTSSAGGIAELAQLCMSAPATRILNVADATAPTVLEVASAIEQATGLQVNLAPFEGGPSGPSHVGSTPWSVERPYVLDTSRAVALGWQGGEYRDQVADVCRWLVEAGGKGDWRRQFTAFAQYGYDAFDYQAEDELLAAQ